MSIAKLLYILSGDENVKIRKCHLVIVLQSRITWKGERSTLAKHNVLKFFFYQHLYRINAAMQFFPSLANNSVHADGGPRYRVCARLTLRSAPINMSGEKNHNNTQKTHAIMKVLIADIFVGNFIFDKQNKNLLHKRTE